MMSLIVDIHFHHLAEYPMRTEHAIFKCATFHDGRLVKMARILVCCAWPYANGPIHVGHVAGSLMPADIFVRVNRMVGNETLLLSGSDMHGTPITARAGK